MFSLTIPKFSNTTRYAFVFLAVVVASILRATLAPVLGQRVPFILFYPTVALVAWVGGFWPGLVSTILSAFIALYLFIPPVFSLAIPNVTVAGQLVVFLLSSVFISLLAESLHQATRKAEESEASEREQHAQFRITLASIGDGVIVTDARGCVTFMNQVAEALTGWSLDDGRGKPLDEVFNIINEQSRKSVENPALRALDQGLIVGLANHSVLTAKDGTEHAIDDSAAPIRIPGQGIIGAVLVFRDITQRRAAEREVWESRERLRITLASIGDAVVTTDDAGRVNYVNPAAEKLLSYSSEQAADKQLAEVFNIVNEFTRQGAENPVERVLRDGRIVGLANHTLLLRADGVEIPIDDSAAPIRDQDGQVAGVVLVFRDISERRRAEKSQATLAAIVESSEDAIVSKDLDGRIVTWNPGAERLFGYLEDEAVGRPITLIIPPDRLDEEASILARIRRGDRVDHYETVRVRKDGRQIDISLTVSPVKAQDGTVIGASKIARDITERKRMERQLQEADRQKDNFIAILAHELRNPLNPIFNAAKLLEIERPDDRQVLEYSSLIEKEVRQITRLLDDLLDMSRITQGKLSLQKKLIDLASAVNDAIQTSRPVIEEAGHRLTIQLPGKALIMHADPARLVQVFSNLLNNAAKFTDVGGDINVIVEAQDSQATVRVKDSGVGIAPELMPKIFDMFVQGEAITQRTRGGLGLGLTVAREIVEAHGGTIEAKSDGLRQGSELIVRLPLSDPVPLPQIPDSADPLLPPASSPLRIVVVDDNKAQALSLQRLLQVIGHEVRVAYDASSAMKLLSDFVPDIALIDLGLPTISGYELARWMHEQPRLAKVILVAQTGWGRDEDRSRAREAGFVHHLVKPIDHQLLVNILTQSQQKKDQSP